MNEIKQPTIKRNAILNICRTFLSILFPLITFPYATRVLLPNGIGRVQFASGLISYFVMIAGLGIGTYGIRETAKKRDNQDSLTKVTKELFIINIISTFISYCIFFIVLILVPKFSEYRNILIVYSATILFSTIGIEWLYSGLEQYAYITIRQLFFQVCSLIALFIFVRKQDDTLKYAAISVISNVGANFCNFIYSRKYIKWRLPIKLELLQHLKPILIFFGMRIAVTFYTALDTTLLGFMTKDEYVGYYETANKIPRIIVMLIMSVVTVLIPRFSWMIENKNEKGFKEMAEKSFNLLLMFSIPMAVGTNILSKNIILIVSGEKFLNASISMNYLSMLIFIIPFSNFLGNQIFLPLGKEHFSFISVVLGAIVNLILSIILIKRIGAIGAAIATMIAEATVSLFDFVLALKITNIKFIGKSTCQYVISTFFMGILLIYTNKLPLKLGPRTILCILIGIIIYVFSLLLFRNPYFLLLVTQFFKKNCEKNYK